MNISTQERGLADVRCILVNPFLRPADLRGEQQTIDGENTHESALNYGLLAVATSLAKHGAAVEILDLEQRKSDWEDHLTRAVERLKPQWMGIGSVSVYSFLPAVDLLRFCRRQFPNLRTVIGGQNAANFPELLQAAGDTSLADYVVCGDGEVVIRQLAFAIANRREVRARGVVALSAGEPFKREFARRASLDEEASFLLYDLYPGFRKLWPVVEESRGCPYHCDFCANSFQRAPSIVFKSPQVLMDELRRVFALYNASGPLPVVLMTSIFGLHSAQTREFFNLIREEEFLPRFIASTRVDLHCERYVDVVAEYFDQMHFGLESGSASVLAQMRKSASPDEYLRSASMTLKAWHDRGAHTAINFILGYPGEDSATIEETTSFLRANRGNIDSVWGGWAYGLPRLPIREQHRRVRSEGRKTRTDFGIL